MSRDGKIMLVIGIVGLAALFLYFAPAANERMANYEAQRFTVNDGERTYSLSLESPLAQRLIDQSKGGSL